MRKLQIAFLSIFLLLSIFVAVLVSPFSLAILSKIAPLFSVQISDAKGSIFDFQAKQIQHPSFSIKDIRYDIKASCLLEFRFCLKSLNIKALRLNSSDNSEAPAPTTNGAWLSELSLPQLGIELDIESLQIEQLHLAEQDLPVEAINARLIWRDGLINLQSLSARYNGATAALEGELKQAQRLLINLDFSANLGPAYDNGKATLLLRGDASSIQFLLEASGPVEAKGSGRFDTSTAVIDSVLSLSHFNAEIDDQNYRLDQAHIEAKGTWPQLAIKLAAQGNADLLGALSINTEISTVDANIWTLSNTTMSLLGGKVIADAQLSLGADSGGSPKLHTELQLKDIDIGLLLPEVSSNIDGEISVNAFKIDTDAERWSLNSSTAALRSQWQGQALDLDTTVSSADGETITIEQLSLKGPQNTLDISGKASLKKITLNADLNLNALEAIYPPLQGAITGKVDIASADDPLQSLIDSLSAKAELNVSNLSYADNSLDHAALEVNLGSNIDFQHRVNFTAKNLALADQRVDSLEFELEGSRADHRARLFIAQAQAELVSRLSGVIDIDELRWQGELEQLSAQLQGHTLDLKAQTGLSVDLSQQNAELGAHCWQIDAETLCIDVAKLGMDGELKGELKNINLRAAEAFIAKPTRLSGTLSGPFALTWEDAQLKTMTSQLTALDLNVEDPRLRPKNLVFKRFDLEANAVADKLKIQAYVDAGKNGMLDLESTLALPVFSGDLSAELKGFDLETIAAFIPAPTLLSGQISGPLSAAWEDLSLRTVKADLQAANLKIVDPRLPEQTLRFDQAALQVDGDLSRMAIRANIASNLSGAVLLKGDLLINEKSIDAALSVRQLGFAPWRSISNEIQSVNGQLDADISIEGPWLRPNLLGELKLSELDLSLARYQDYKIIGGDGNITFNGDQVQAQVALQTSLGAINIDGDGSLPNSFKLRVTSPRLTVPYPQIGEVTLEPNLHLQWSENTAHINGAVHIPEAEINLQTLPTSAPAVSADVVFVDGRPDPNQNKGQNTPFDFDVDITLGDAVNFSGYGLKSRLSGGVSARALAGQNLGLFGSLQLLDAKYDAYGQVLDVQSGNIILSGSPGQGRITMQAYRAGLSDVEVGIKVSGPLQAPSVKLISSPAMRDSEKASYLLTGQLSAAGMGTSIAQSLFKRLLPQQNADSKVNVNATGSGDDTAVGVSGRINDRLTIRYDLGLFKPINTFTLRYDLSKSVYLEFVKSIETAFNVFYSFEFGN